MMMHGLANPKLSFIYLLFRNQKITNADSCHLRRFLFTDSQVILASLLTQHYLVIVFCYLDLQLVTPSQY